MSELLTALIALVVGSFLYLVFFGVSPRHVSEIVEYCEGDKTCINYEIDCAQHGNRWMAACPEWRNR
jgi:hypothetical protein